MVWQCTGVLGVQYQVVWLVVSRAKRMDQSHTALYPFWSITGSTIFVVILMLREEDLGWSSLNNVYILLYTKGIVGSFFLVLLEVNILSCTPARVVNLTTKVQSYLVYWPAVQIFTPTQTRQHRKLDAQVTCNMNDIFVLGLFTYIFYLGYTVHTSMQRTVPLEHHHIWLVDGTVWPRWWYSCSPLSSMCLCMEVQWFQF